MTISHRSCSHKCPRHGTQSPKCVYYPFVSVGTSAILLIDLFLRILFVNGSRWSQGSHIEAFDDITSFPIRSVRYVRKNIKGERLFFERSRPLNHF